MTEWRLFRGWSERELEERLRRLEGLELNFREAPEEMTPERGWNRTSSEAVVAREAPGPPLEAGPFERARVAVANFTFSDPAIVTGHFDPETPLPGRRVLLELRVLGLRYLGGVVVGAVRAPENEKESVFGFRFETLEGHIERGSEWFLLAKDQATGEVRFRVDAVWRPGDFPNWWSRAGFHFLAPRRQEEWHRRAHRRLSLLARHGSLEPPVPEHGRLVHEGPEVVFRRVPGKG